MSSLPRLTFTWTGFLLLWLLFVFQVTEAELIVGGLASAIALAAASVTFRVVPACFKPRLRWIVELWRLPAMTAIDIGLLWKHLVNRIARQPSRSALEVTKFRSGEGCEETARRALVVLFVSVAPNSVVLDIDREKGEMLYHQLEPAPVPKLLKNLQD